MKIKKDIQLKLSKALKYIEEGNSIRSTVKLFEVSDHLIKKYAKQIGKCHVLPTKDKKSYSEKQHRTVIDLRKKKVKWQTISDISGMSIPGAAIYSYKNGIKPNEYKSINLPFHKLFQIVGLIYTYPDRRKEITKKYKLKRKALQNTANKGIVYSLNKAIPEAKGDYIARMDADDIAYPFRLDTLVSWMEQNPDVLVCGSAMKIHNTKATADVAESRFDINRNMFINCPMLHPTVLIRSKVFRELGLKYENYQHAEDYKLWFEISKKGKLANLNMPLVEYRLHSNQVSQKYSS
ncbi:glycosyltransferase [Psittacicella hinzii]|uniref:Glycosyltransferase 2-like domain-containing protein n=1 Tax=Psittacicella hinzii TaxID=2028575 RepID=A0A3A1YI12_9GAMM|nr:glycosyltransferase [Psittacicella hinzii]RIY37893.1 hypothetical protein CKF58_04515 [Psittacicella hinzii]